MDNSSDAMKDLVKDMLLDDYLQKRCLELVNQLYVEGSSSTPRRMIYRNHESGHREIILHKIWCTHQKRSDEDFEWGDILSFVS